MTADVTVKKKYDDFLLDISFAVSGKRIGILGASGCGKSQTLMSIAGLVRPDEGKISIDQNVLYDHAGSIDIKPQKRNVGYLFQEYALFPNMTVEGNIDAAILGAKKSGRNPAADTGKFIKKFELADVKDHFSHELSGGQKQRCALARMLASDPQLLLLDEPFSAMDSYLREGMRLELINILGEYDRSVIMVSHDRDELYQMCDILLLMDNGKIIASGETQRVFADPGTVAAARLTGCKNISRIEKINGHRVRALDWGGTELVTGNETEDDITHIGIRAHDLLPGEHGENVIPCAGAKISKLPFEWYVTLENGLWWKIPKRLSEEDPRDVVPSHLSIPPDKLILLRSD